jgi:T5SS/PEP-CTERM-associated repeat protein
MRFSKFLASRGFLIGAIVLSTADVAVAQITATGTNFPEPVTNGTTNNYTIGWGGVGTLSILGGSSFTAGSLDAGDLGTGNGTITIDGSGTTVTLNPQGMTNILQPGNWGVGSVTISGGAVVDGTNTAGCAANWCNSFVGNGAGSTGTLTVTGTGSSLSLPDSTSFVVGQDTVQDYMGSPFGTPGGATHAYLNVTAGGTLNTGSSTIAQNGNMYTPPPGSIYVPTGTETATATAIVNNGTWNITSPQGWALVLGNGSNSTGSLSVVNHGAVNISATPSSAQVGIALGETGGSGSILVDGGSIKFTSGAGDYVNVGDYQGSGAITVKGGGSISGALSANIGADGSTGSLTVSGAGSSFTVSGANGGNGAFIGVGTTDTPALASTLGPTTNGALTVNDGGQVTIDTDGNGGGAGLVAGQNGGTGVVTVTGAGSKIAISGNNGNSGNGGGSTIGQSGKGTLNVLAGGQYDVDNTGAAGNSGIAIGGDSYQVSTGAQAGVGVVTVSGAGSELNVQSAHGFIAVGYTGTGTLKVSDGGAVSAEGIKIAALSGSNGTVSVNDASIALSGSDSATGTGARALVGAAGVGSLSLTNGASLLITPSTSYGGIYIGGESGLYGGVGTMSVSGGSTAFVSGTNDQLDVGRNGTGTLNISGGSTVDVAHGTGSTGQTFVGATASNTPPVGGALAGRISVAGGSTLDAGSLLGIGSNGAGNNDTGTGSVFLSGMSTVNATEVVIGQNGLLGGNGTVNGDITNNGGTLSPGASPDPLYINGNYEQTGGVIDLEVLPNGTGGFLTDTVVFGVGDTVQITGALINIVFRDGADPTLFEDDGLLNYDTFFRVANPGGTGDLPLSSEFPLDSVFSDVTIAVSTPEPGTWVMLAVGFFGLTGLGYRRRVKAPAARGGAYC